MSRQDRILLVEDSRTQALSLTHVLEREGWGVDWAPTVETALECLNQNSPDLILLDFYLPDLRGDELCRRIRMNVAARSIPIMMLTMDDTHEAELRGLESGADDFVPKSIDSEILLARIRTLLRKSASQCTVPGLVDQRFRRARLLTIDDSATYQEYLAAELEQEGYVIERAMGGREGLDRLLTESFDLALVDLVMPEVNGIEVCRQVSARRGTTDNDVALLILTGRESKEDLTQALEAGADDFVGKSSDQAVLKGRIRALLRRKFFQGENQRILAELKNKELEAITARAEKEAALATAADERRRQAEAVAVELSAAKAELEKYNEELMRSNDELRQFAFVASHDLQEPLRSITSFSCLLKEDCQGQLGQEADDHIERIVNGAARMKALVTDLLGYSRVSRDEQIRFERVDFLDVVRDALANLQTSIQESGAAVTWGELPAVLGDRVQLVQLLQNLIGNAIMYRSDAPPRIHVAATRDADDWQFSVRDNGIGIAPEHQLQIFEIFKRLHGREKYPGTGIGLAVCKKIVQRHDGRIWVESQPGQGSVFRFTIGATAEESSDERETQCVASV